MRILVILLFFLLAFPVFSGSKKGEVDTLHERCYVYLESNLDSVIVLANKAVSISEDIGYQWGRANSLYILGYVYDQKEEPSKSIICYLRAEHLLRKSFDKRSIKVRMGLLMNTGIILFDHYKYSKAVDFYNEAIKLLDRSGFDLQSTRAEVLYSLARALRKMGHLDDAIKNLKDAHQLALGSTNEYILLNSWNLVGLIYKDNEDYADAREVYGKILDYGYKSLNPEEFRGMALHNIANTYVEEENYAMAEQYFLEALKEKEASGIPDAPFITLMDLTDLYLTTGEYGHAKETGLRAEELYDQVSLKSENLKIFNFLSKVHYALKDYERAASFSDRYVEESVRFDDEQVEILKLKEQYKIDLVLAGFYQEISSKEEISLLERVIIVLSIAFSVIIMITFLVQLFRKRRFKGVIEREIRDIESRFPI